MKNRVTLKNRKKVIICLALVIVFVILLAALIAVGINKSNNKPIAVESAAEKLNGSYVYNKDTVYEFDGKGKGCLVINNEYRYDYDYSIDGDKLSLVFNHPEISDATYQFTLFKNKLKLVGLDGTVGGEYELTKQK